MRKYSSPALKSSGKSIDFDRQFGNRANNPAAWYLADFDSISMRRDIIRRVSCIIYTVHTRMQKSHFKRITIACGLNTRSIRE